MAAKYPTGSVAVSFQSGKAGQADAAGAASLSLDDEKNLAVYGEAKSTFQAGETAYLKLHEAGPRYNLDCSAGVVGVDATNIAYSYTENIQFALSLAEDLQRIPDTTNTISYVWIGKSGGTPLFSGKIVALPSKVTARILRTDYKSLGDRLKLRVTAADMGPHAQMEVLVVVYKGDKVLASTTVSFERKVRVAVPVELSVADFCSDLKVGNVNVFLNGSFVGKTDSKGTIFLGNLMQGNHYSLTMVREGYTDSSLDVLHNDSFVVPED
jgi:hypothetical protein